LHTDIGALAGAAHAHEPAASQRHDMPITLHTGLRLARGLDIGVSALQQVIWIDSAKHDVPVAAYNATF